MEETREEIMTEEENQTTEAPAAPEKGKKGKKKAGEITDPNEAVKALSAGKLILFKPFLADDKEVTELNYDFEHLGGPEMMKAMDRGARNGGNAFRITNEQALELFIASAGKETEGCDADDVRRGLSSVDAVKAVQLATVFFVASSQSGNARITK